MMKLLLAFAALVAVANCQLGGLTGGWTTVEDVPQEVVTLARWAVARLNKDLSSQGEYSLHNVRNVKVQVVAGFNYKFTIDAMFVSFDGKQSFQSCEVSIFSQPWTDTIQFNESPKCY